jgi:hypothetical protein
MLLVKRLTRGRRKSYSNFSPQPPSRSPRDHDSASRTRIGGSFLPADQGRLRSRFDARPTAPGAGQERPHPTGCAVCRPSDRL